MDIAESQWEKQDGFESFMMEKDWGYAKVPLCISIKGLFGHVEIDG